MGNLSDYISVNELAERLGMAPATIRRYQKTKPDRVPPVYDFFGHPRFKRSDVEVWEKSCKRITRDKSVNVDTFEK